MEASGGLSMEGLLAVSLNTRALAPFLRKRCRAEERRCSGGPVVTEEIVMRVAVMPAPGQVRVEHRPEPEITDPADAIIRLPASCICGSGLWPYRGVEPLDEPQLMGHEYAGFVEEVGDQVTTIN
jgi:hypothetical protein